MALRSLKQLRKRIQRYRRGSAPLTWAHICNILEIFTEDGKPNTGLAEDIGFKVVNFHGFEREYYPSPEIAVRLKIQPRCLGCMRPIKDVTKEPHQRHIEDYEKWWRGLDINTRRTFLFNLYERYKNIT